MGCVRESFLIFEVGGGLDEQDAPGVWVFNQLRVGRRNAAIKKRRDEIISRSRRRSDATTSKKNWSDALQHNKSNVRCRAPGEFQGPKVCD